MQTFLPYPDFEKTAKTLDYRRLGKQRVECKQILNALQKEKGGWVNHPATKMWRGYEDALRLYMNTMITEWVNRGYKNTMALQEHQPSPPMPPWLGDMAFHASHRANLLRKDPTYYGQFDWDEDPTSPYIWPV